MHLPLFFDLCHSPASEEKFRSLYKIADAVDFEDAVINLVTLAQTALYLFNLLRRDCVDGLICDETNAAFGEFYRKYQPYKGSTVILKQQVALYDPTGTMICWLTFLLVLLHSTP